MKNIKKKNIKKKNIGRRALNKCIQNVGFIFGTLLMAPIAMAQQAKDVTDVADNIGSTATGVLDAIFILCAFVGFVMFVINGVKLMSERKQGQDSDISTWKQLGAGIFLMTPLLYLSLFVNSVTKEGDQVSIEKSMGIGE